MKQGLLFVITCWGLMGCHLWIENSDSHSRASTTYAELGLSYLARGRPDLALEALLKAKAMAPYNAMAWEALGYYHERSEQTKEAAEAYRKAIYLSPHEGRTHNNYGAFLCRQGQYAKGMAELQAALRLEYYANRQKTEKNYERCLQMARKSLSYPL